MNTGCGLNRNFEDFHLGICVKRNSVVLYQNHECASLCGDQVAKTCEKCTHRSRGKMRYSLFQNNVRLVTTHYDGEYKVTILSSVNPLVSRTISDFLSTSDLTSQEREVLKLIFQGYSNDDIRNLLFISKSTLKTHINHLHQKIPLLISFRKKYI